jgi:hypothetical protein
MTKRAKPLASVPQVGGLRRIAIAIRGFIS